MIRKSLIFLNKLDFTKSYKIIVINKFSSKNDYVKINNNIKFYKFSKNMKEIYKRTFFSIGACGISLYEKCYYNIPTIAKCLAKNQRYNFKHFYEENCILNFDNILKLSFDKKTDKKDFFIKMNKVKNNITKKFDYKKNKLYLTKLFHSLGDN